MNQCVRAHRQSRFESDATIAIHDDKSSAAVSMASPLSGVACRTDCWRAGQPAAVASPREFTVLVIYSSSRLLPANIEGDRGLRQGLRSTADRPVLIIDEYLDMPRLGGPAYEQTMRTYLHDKYAQRMPDVVILAGEGLPFLLAHRAYIFPGLPLVHMGVLASTVEASAPLPPDVIGVPFELEFAGTSSRHCAGIRRRVASSSSRAARRSIVASSPAFIHWRRASRRGHRSSSCRACPTPRC